MALATDLSTAFDTIDHEILLKKLEFYGIRDQSLRLFESFLSNRLCMVELETFKSPVLEQGPYSCIQGSKISGLLYNIYTNEVPKLFNIIKDPKKYETLTGEYPNIHDILDHLTINYVEDT